MAEPLKHMFNERFVDDIGAAIVSAYPVFDRTGFKAQVLDSAWEGRALKARLRHVTLMMHEFLPGNYRQVLTILRAASAALPSQYNFEALVFPDFVELYGLDDWEASIEALEQFTQQSSAESAVRPFIMRDSVRMMAQMQRWTEHESHHVRRLASEGCRPLLPWTQVLTAFRADPSPILPVLNALRNDSSEYVRRSVANNLNDISKDHPHVVVDVLRRWQVDNTPEIRWITGHALRTLAKRGDLNALGLLGYADRPAVEIGNFVLASEAVAMGGEMVFSFTLTSLADAPQSLMVDYVMHFMKANGKQAPKVFKLRKIQLAPGETVQISKRHSFAPISTRVYYPGAHGVELQINGCGFGVREFSVVSDQSSVKDRTE